MKPKILFLVALPVTIIVLLSASVSFSGSDLWPKKEGELCWDVYSIPGSTSPTGFLRLYILKTGENYYLVHGSNIEADDEPLVNGNAIVYEDKIMIHASSSSYDDDEVRGWLGTVQLDRESLDGSFQGVGINWEKTTPPVGYVTSDGEQELLLTDCPQ